MFIVNIIDVYEQQLWNNINSTLCSVLHKWVTMHPRAPMLVFIRVRLLHVGAHLEGHGDLWEVLCALNTGKGSKVMPVGVRSTSTHSCCRWKFHKVFVVYIVSSRCHHPFVFIEQSPGGRKVSTTLSCNVPTLSGHDPKVDPIGQHVATRRFQQHSHVHHLWSPTIWMCGWWWQIWDLVSQPGWGAGVLMSVGQTGPFSSSTRGAAILPATVFIYKSFLWDQTLRWGPSQRLFLTQLEIHALQILVMSTNTHHLVLSFLVWGLKRSSFSPFMEVLPFINQIILDIQLHFVIIVV